jgi:hypothetical protein
MIILLNGPPGSGKDTAAEFIILALGNSKVHHDKLSKPLKSSLRTIFNFSITEMRALEAYKDHSNGPEYGDLSWRQMQIEMFKSLEASYGPRVLGHLFVRRNRDNAKRHTVISDAGRTIEIQPIIESNPFDQIGCIHLSRPECDYSNDIREYIDTKDIGHVEDVNNKYDLELFKAQIRKVLRKWELLDDEDN